MTIFSAGPTYDGEVVRVVDGDTLDVLVDLGFNIQHKIRIRLIDVDTPEVYGVKHDSEEYNRGIEASAFTRQWLEDRCPSGRWGPRISLRTLKGTGKYGRWIATVWPLTLPLLDSDTLNSALQSKGWR